MICVETIGKIRRWHRVDKLSISEIAKRLSASRNTIAKYVAGEVTQPRYKQRPKRAPVLGVWVERLEAMLVADRPPGAAVLAVAQVVADDDEGPGRDREFDRRVRCGRGDVRDRAPPRR